MSDKYLSKRTAERQAMLYYLNVENSRNLEMRLLDISLTGARFLASGEYAPGDQFDGLVRSEGLDSDFKELSLRLRVAWCHKANRPGYFEIGCSFEELGVEEKSRLTDLIDEFSVITIN